MTCDCDACDGMNFTQFECHCPLRDPGPKAVMSDMPRYHNWYIQKDLCLVHSEFVLLDMDAASLRGGFIRGRRYCMNSSMNRPRAEALP